MKAFWKKICRIFGINSIGMTETKNMTEIHATKDGQLYIDREDFFNDDSVRSTISSILNSKSVKRVLAKTNSARAKNGGDINQGSIKDKL